MEEAEARWDRRTGRAFRVGGDEWRAVGVSAARISVAGLRLTPRMPDLLDVRRQDIERVQVLR